MIKGVAACISRVCASVQLLFQSAPFCMTAHRSSTVAFGRTSLWMQIQQEAYWGNYRNACLLVFFCFVFCHCDTKEERSETNMCEFLVSKSLSKTGSYCVILTTQIEKKNVKNVSWRIYRYAIVFQLNST